MTEETSSLNKLLVSAEFLIAEVKGNPWEAYLRSHLIPVRVELERQIGLSSEHQAASPESKRFRPPPLEGV